jgi:multidrug efflux pump subunit AcrB
VTATLPGASADTMAASVAGIIERQLSTIAGISSMSSSSSQGATLITIQFDLNRNIDAAALDVQTALTIAQRRLPIEMTIPPSFRKVSPADFPVLFVSLGSATLPLSAVNEYGDITIGQALSQIPGVAQVTIYGAQKFAIRVQADPKENFILRWFEAMFGAWLRGYEWALDWVLAKKALMLVVTLATLGGTVFLYMIVPKGFFPQEDTGFLTGVTEAATDTSFEAMKVRQQALVDVLKSDPAVDYINSTVGSGGPTRLRITAGCSSP